MQKSIDHKKISMPDKNNINIAIVVTNLASSGAEKVALAQAKMFKEHKNSVVLFLLENIVKYDIRKFDFPIIPLTDKKDKYKFLGKFGDFIYSKILEKKMKGFGEFNVIFSNLPRADRVVKLLNHPKKYFVIHTSYKAELKNFKPKRARKKLKLYQYIYKDEYILPVAKEIVNDFQELNIRYKDEKTIYNPFDFENIRKRGDEKVDISYDYIISPSAFREQKRYDIMLDAFKMVKKDVKLLILAKKDPKLNEMIRERGLEDRVEILGFQQNPYKYIKNAKLLVLSSDREGLPTIIIESMILGTPVVSTNCPTGPKEILTKELSRWLVPMQNPKRLAEKIDDALESKIPIEEENIERFHKNSIYRELTKLF